jgi:hypothetical protein
MAARGAVLYFKESSFGHKRKLVYDAMVKGYGVTRDVVKNILKSLD